MYVMQAPEARPAESAQLLSSTCDAAYESSPFVYGLQLLNFFRHLSKPSRNMRIKYIKPKVSEDSIKRYVSFVTVKTHLSTVTCESHTLTGCLQILRPRIIVKWVERRRFKWKKRFYKECMMHERSGGRAQGGLVLRRLPREFISSFGYTEIVGNQQKQDEVAPRFCSYSRISSYLPWDEPSPTTPPRSTPPQPTPPRAIPLRASPLRGTLPQSTLPQAMSARYTSPWATPSRGTPPQAKPLRVTLPRAIPPQGTLAVATPTRATSPWATSPRVTAPQATPPRATLPRATLPRTTPTRATPSRAMPPRAMPPRATPTRATPPRVRPPRATPPRFRPPRATITSATLPMVTLPRATLPRATPLRDKLSPVTPPQGTQAWATPPWATLPRATSPQSTPACATPSRATLPSATPPQATWPRVTLSIGTLPQAPPPQVTPPQGTLTWATLPRATLPRTTSPQRSSAWATPSRTALPRATLPRASPPRVTWPRVTLSSATLPQAMPSQATPPQETLTWATLPRVTLPLRANLQAYQNDMNAGGQLPPPPASCGERLAPPQPWAAHAPGRFLPRVQQAVVRIKDTFQDAQRRTEYEPPEFCLYKQCAGHNPSGEDSDDDTLHSFAPASDQMRAWSAMRRIRAERERREEQRKAEEKQMPDEEPKQIYQIKDDIYLRDFPSDASASSPGACVPCGLCPGGRQLARGALGPGSRCLLARDFGHRLLVMEFEYDPWTSASILGTNIDSYFQGTSTHAEFISDKWFSFKPNFDKSTNVEEETITESSTVNFKTDTQKKGNSNCDIEDPDKITISTTNNCRSIVHSTGLGRHASCPPLHIINSSQNLAVEINTNETSVTVRNFDSNIKYSCDATVFTKEISDETETDMAEKKPVTLKSKEPATTYVPVTLSNNYDTSITANQFSDIGTGFPKLPRNPKRNTVAMNTCDIRASKSDETMVVGVRALPKSKINGANIVLSDVGTCTAKLPRNPKIASDEYNLYYTVADIQRSYKTKNINIEMTRSTNTTVSVGLDPMTEIPRTTDDGKKNENSLHSALHVFNKNLIDFTDSCNATKRSLIFSDVGISTTKLLRNPKQDTVECNTSFTTTGALAGTLRASDISNGIFKPRSVLIKRATFNKESGKENIGLAADFKVNSKKTDAYSSVSHVYLSTTNTKRSTAKNSELVADAQIETDKLYQINGSTTTVSDATFIKPVCNHFLHIAKRYVTAKDINMKKITKIKDDDDGSSKMFSGSAVITNRSMGEIAIEETDKALINLADNCNATNRAKMFSDVGISTTKLLHHPKQNQVSCQHISHKSGCVIKLCHVSGIAKSIKLNGKFVRMNIELADFSHVKRSSQKTDASSYTPYVFLSTACGNRFTATNDEITSHAEDVKNQYAMTLTDQKFCEREGVIKLTKDYLQNLKRNSDKQRNTPKYTTSAPNAGTNAVVTPSEADKSTDDEKYCQGDSETGIRYRFLNKRFAEKDSSDITLENKDCETRNTALMFTKSSNCCNAKLS